MEYRLFEKGDRVEGDGFVGTVQGYFVSSIGSAQGFLYVVSTTNGPNGVEMAMEEDLKPVRPARDISP